MDRKYWKVDVIDFEEECEGYSLCVSTHDNETEDSIIDLCLTNGLIDRFDVKEFNVIAEEITDDDYEMSHWRDMVVNLD